MLQKYLILRDLDSGNVTIEEKAVIDPIPRGSDPSRLTDNDYHLINFVTYRREKIETAIKQDHSALVSAIRNPYFFPIKEHCDAIAAALVQIYDGDETAVELEFDTCDMGDQFEAED